KSTRSRTDKAPDIVRLAFNFALRRRKGAKQTLKISHAGVELAKALFDSQKVVGRVEHRSLDGVRLQSHQSILRGAYEHHCDVPFRIKPVFADHRPGDLEREPA